jgi:hypothetical protein
MRIVQIYEREKGNRSATLRSENGNYFHAWETRYHPAYWLFCLFGLRRHKAYGLEGLKRAKVKDDEIVYAKPNERKGRGDS